MRVQLACGGRASAHVHVPHSIAAAAMYDALNDWPIRCGTTFCTILLFGDADWP